MIETKILVLEYGLFSVEYAEKIYEKIKEQIENTKIKSVEIVPKDYRIYVDGGFFKNPIPFNEYVQKANVMISVDPLDKEQSLKFLKKIAQEVLPEFMKPWGLVITTYEKSIVTQDLY